MRVEVVCGVAADLKGHPVVLKSVGSFVVGCFFFFPKEMFYF